MKYAKGDFFWGKDGQLESTPGELGVKRTASVGEIHLPLTEGVFPNLISLSRPLEEQKKAFREFVGNAYLLNGNYGPNGDIIHARMVVANDDSAFFSIEYIAALAYQKPGLAADLVIFVTTKFGEYFVGIKRKKNPGANKVALIGGFRDIKGYEFEPAILTALREAKEEVGLSCQLTKKQKKKCRADLNLDQLEVEVSFGGEDCTGELVRVGEFTTGDEERVESLGVKRVYATTAFVLRVGLPYGFAEGEIAEMFEADDDAKEIVVIPLGDLSKTEFGLSHHETIMQAALDKVWGDVQTFEEKGG